MGFTRFWRIREELDYLKFLEFGDICREIIKDFEIPVKDLVINCNSISFNGASPHGYETFTFTRNSNLIGNNTLGLNFCKTHMAPYDSVVFACLEASKIIFGDNVELIGESENSDDYIRLRLKVLLRDRKIKKIL